MSQEMKKDIKRMFDFYPALLIIFCMTVTCTWPQRGGV